jgi:hypothetical protein
MIAATNALLPADLRPEELEPKAIRARVEAIADLLLYGVMLPRGRR